MMMNALLAAAASSRGVGGCWRARMMSMRSIAAVWQRPQLPTPVHHPNDGSLSTLFPRMIEIRGGRSYCRNSAAAPPVQRRSLLLWTHLGSRRRLTTTTTNTTNTNHGPPSNQDTTDDDVAALVRMYRILLRKVREISATAITTTSLKDREPLLLLQPPLDPIDDGTSRILHHRIPVFVETDWRKILGYFDDAKINYGGRYDERSTSITEQEEEGWENELLSAAGPKANYWYAPDAMRMALSMAFRPRRWLDDNGSPSCEYYRASLKHALATYKILDRLQQLQEQTSVYTSSDHNIRITATSQCVGVMMLQSSPQEQQQHSLSFRYAYRIRIENLSDTETYQLLGRTWIIHQDVSSDETADDSSDTDDGSIHATAGDANVVRVHAPHTGAVGQFPILRPGETFEYQSGTDAGARGLMRGCFHFVHHRRRNSKDDDEEEDATSLSPLSSTTTILDDHGHLDSISHEERFEVPIAPFPLVADEGHLSKKA